MPPSHTEQDNEQQIEYASVKFLLKQVYSAHITKVKGLEDEVKSLKEDLELAKRELNESKSNCKQCKELQDAFATCKTALLEQTKWFENLGQKFSGSKDKGTGSKLDDLSGSEDERPNLSMISKPVQHTHACSEMQPLTFHTHIATETSIQEKKSIKISPIGKSGQASAVLGIISGQQNSFQDTSTFHSESSFILVPDSMEVAGDSNAEGNIDILHTNTGESKLSEIKDNVLAQCDLIISDSSINNEEFHNLKPQPFKKRPLDDFSGCEIKNKKQNNGKSDELLPTHLEVKNNKSEISNSAVCENITNDKFKHSKVREQGESSFTPEQNVYPKDKTLQKITDKYSSDGKAQKKSHLNPLNIQICSASNVHVNDKEMQNSDDDDDLICLDNSTPKDLNDNLKKSSLAIIANKKRLKSFPSESVSSDNDDFQSATVSANYPSDISAAKTCDKKKLQKKKNLKTLKCSSKYKLTLDAPSLNYKRTNYKQTKLSKSIFEIKTSQETVKHSEHKESDAPLPTAKTNIDMKNAITEEDETFIHDAFNKQKRSGSTDFDATCIPENFKSIVTQNPTVILNDIGNVCHPRHGTTINLADDLQSDESSKDSASQDLIHNRYSTDENSPDLLNMMESTTDGTNILEDFKMKQKVNSGSFDRLPMADEPNYKYIENPVRNRAERKQLIAFDCQECEKYYSELGLSDKEKQDRLKQCSRHRAKFLPPATPEHFWELEFPDTQECKVRGYQAETQKVKLKSRRRRPLT